MSVEWVADSIDRAIRLAKFCVSGELSRLDPGIHLAGVGPLSLPLTPEMLKRVIAAGRLAPYGKGKRTLVNKNVRNTFEIDPDKLTLSEAWDAEISAKLPSIAEELGLPSDQLEARLYKLLVYERDGFFVAHRDSEKHDRMVASLIVVLPNPFSGGKLCVRHGVVEKRIGFDAAVAGDAPCYAAFYADCEHEVERVYSGVRLALAYNLVLKADQSPPKSVNSSDQTRDPATEAIHTWIEKNPSVPLVFAMEHHYTQAGLSPDLLKGTDRQLADLVVAAAERTNCQVYLCQVERHLCQYADDGNYGGKYSSYETFSSDQVDIGETFDDELFGTEWTDLSGQKQPWQEIPFELSAIVSSTPLETWSPTKEEYEGYTGNEGNTLDRWYHRSAIVIWHRDHFWDIIAKSGLDSNILLFASMVKDLPRTPKKQQAAARDECIRFARSILACWTQRYSPQFAFQSFSKIDYDQFVTDLQSLHDQELNTKFLRTIAEHNQVIRLGNFPLEVSREFGWDAFAEELKLLWSSRAKPRFADSGSLICNAEWLTAFCCDKSTSKKRIALGAELCSLAVESLIEPETSPRSYGRSRVRKLSEEETVLPKLIQSLLAVKNDTALGRLIQFVRASPKRFRIGEAQVSTLKTVISWIRERKGKVHPHIRQWLADVRSDLESATAEAPTPPADWVRPINRTCSCVDCRALAAFLADPTREVEQWPLNENRRKHLQLIIDREECDVDPTTNRSTRPYTLVLTKACRSYERAVKEYEENQRLLKSLPKLK